ncbi:hypothetical protein Scep_004855 [Stephania cephalantha]|uniref:Uncharacterized protein n=1 Tax=Stephania cephalantha TaxID=152367 RepID=A0AAP0KTF0_9MAGN
MKPNNNTMTTKHNQHATAQPLSFLRPLNSSCNLFSLSIRSNFLNNPFITIVAGTPQ